MNPNGVIPGLLTFSDYWGAPAGQPDNTAFVTQSTTANTAVPVTFNPFGAENALRIGIILVIIIAAGVLLSYYIEKE